MRTLLTVLGLSAGLTWATAQSPIALNYASGFGDCEVDEDADGLADQWLLYHSFGNQSWTEVGVTPTLSRVKRFTGERSQQITISRPAGEAGRIYLDARPIRPENVPYILPPAGTPLLVRVRVQTENLSGISARVVIYSGERQYVLANALPANTGGWHTLSAVVPLERLTTGELRFHFVLELNLSNGATSGQLWVDSLEVLWTQYPAPIRPRPNMLKIFHYIVPVSHWQELMDPPVDIAILPLNVVHALRPYLPNAKLGIYINAAQTFDRLPVPWQDLYGGYHFISQSHPHWFLRQNGNPFSNPGYPYLWPLDIGLQEVRDRFVQQFLRVREQIPIPEWVFLDDLGSFWQCDQYPNLDINQQAWTGFIEYVFPTIRQRIGNTPRFIMNSGSWAGRFVDGNPGEQWIQHLDGVMLEHVIVLYRRNNGGEYVYQPYRFNRRTLHMTDSTWWGTLRAVNAFPNKIWLLLPMCDANENPQMFRYILASYFVMAHSNTYLMVEDRRTRSNTYHKWVHRPEPWIPIGNPTGNWYVAAGTTNDHTGALFARNFEYGIVLVNPTESQTYEYTLPRAYKNWDGQVISAGTRVQIGPKTGLAFYAAPEIVINLSPQQVTALPGETVTFTVQYRNDGLADGTNIRISIPLPDGLEFVSSSTGGQFLNRQITWTLPQVRAGQSGTLTFQARVQ